MATLSHLFGPCNSRLMAVEQSVGLYESDFSERRVDREQEIDYTFNGLQRDLLQLETLSQQEFSTRREMWRSRVLSLQQRLNSSRTTYQRLHQIELQKRRASQTRSQLLGDPQQRRLQHSSALNGVDQLTREQASLQQSHRQLDDQLDMGSSVLSSLQQQRDLLKRSQRKALDVVNVLGLSNTLLRMSERYESVNAIIVYGCMLITLAILFVTYYYFRYLPKHGGR